MPGEIGRRQRGLPVVGVNDLGSERSDRAYREAVYRVIGTFLGGTAAALFRVPAVVAAATA